MGFPTFIEEVFPVNPQGGFLAKLLAKVCGTKERSDPCLKAGAFVGLVICFKAAVSCFLAL